MADRSIAVFTGSRAEYGLLRHLIAALKTEQGIILQLIASGSHLSERLGKTLVEIVADGIEPAALVPLSLDKTPQPSMADLTAEALEGVSQCLEGLQPELLILLGDRYEAFAAAAAAHLQCIPVVHIHGGETTEGAVDDRLRHAISQLSTWHFTSAEPHRQRVIAMGHPPERVLNVGPMVLDGLLMASSASKTNFEELTGYRFGKSNLLVTYHSETLLDNRGLAGFEALLQALEQIPCNVFFTYPNSDSGSDQLLLKLNTFIATHPQRCWVVKSLGQKCYLEALQLFDAMAGNSSSGIIEAPLLGMPVLNIGSRQLGRFCYGPVCHVTSEYIAILNGLKQVLSFGSEVDMPRSFPTKQPSPTKMIISWLRGHLRDKITNTEQSS